MEPVLFPDTVAVTVVYLRAALAVHGPVVPVVTRVPAARPARFVRLERIGGPRRDLVTDGPRLDVHCWGASEEDAHDLAQLARALLLAMPGWHGATVYRVEEVGGPNNLPDPESGQARFALAVELHVRGRTLAGP